MEREVIRRTGPHAFYRTTSSTDPSHSTTTRVYSLDLLTTMTIGGYAGMWLLRRGRRTDGNPVAGFKATDRQRRVALWERNLGYLQVDYPYDYAPEPEEPFELCYLNPAQVIRPALQAGLGRCRIEDRVTLTLTGVAGERDLTAVHPWLVKRSQVAGVSYKQGASLYDPAPVRWFDTFNQGGHLWLTASPDPLPQTIYLTVQRPADTLINGVTVVPGPLQDTDELPVPLPYAAAGAHIECWRIARALLQATASTGVQTTQADAADEFTRMQRIHVVRRPAEWKLSRPLWGAGVGGG